MVSVSAIDIMARLAALDEQAAQLSRRLSEGEDSAAIWRECEQVTDEFEVLLEELRRVS